MYAKGEDDAGVPTVRPAFICVEKYPNFTAEATYTVFVYVVLYVVPVIVIYATYSLIAYRLWLRGPIGEDVPRDALRRHEEKKQVTRMLIIIVVVHSLSWFPFFSLHIYHLFHQFEGYSAASFRRLQVALQLLGYSTTCSNPASYCLMNESFQKHLLQTLRSSCWLRCRLHKLYRRSDSSSTSQGSRPRSNTLTLSVGQGIEQTDHTLHVAANHIVHPPPKSISPQLRGSPALQA